MGIIKAIIATIVADKIEESINGKVDKKNSPGNNYKPKEKKTLFQTKKEFSEFLCGYTIYAQFMFALVAILCQVDSINLIVLHRSYAMGVLISGLLFVVGAIIYGLYRIDFLPLLFLFFPVPLVAIMSLYFNDELYILRDILSGTWLDGIVICFICILGILSLVASFMYLCYSESEKKDKKSEGKKIPAISNEEIEEKRVKLAEEAKRKQEEAERKREEAERKRKALIESIEKNAILVHFLNKKWKFLENTDVLFGYDSQNEQFVFVNNQNSYVLDHKKVIYLDFEDAQVGVNGYQRIIKLYYLGALKDEQVIPLIHVCTNEETINLIKYYVNNSATKNTEIIFRRKIRMLASTLEKDFYPCRPFVDDEWFSRLKECMEAVKNNNIDGYSLFREKVTKSENYMDDGVLFEIICDLSANPPDQTSARKEARKLCFLDFGESLGNNVKNSIRSFFSNGD